MRRCFKARTAGLAALALQLVAGCASGPDDPAPPASLRAELTRAVGRYGVCGAVVATVKDRRLDQVEAAGACDRVGPPRVDSVFQAASLSKPVFAYAVLQLVRQGRMALDAPVMTYLPQGYRHRADLFGLRTDSAPQPVDDPRLARVTVRMALNHSSGLPNWSSGPLRLAAEPGAGWRYSGEAYVLLQRALEAVTGSPLDRHMAEQVFRPLGMTDSSFVWEDRFQGAIVPGTGAGGAPQPVLRFRRPVAAATLYSTAADYGRFVAAALADEGLLTLITQAPVPVDARQGLSWGQGWGLENPGPDAVLWQWGNNPGYRAFVMASPRRGAGFVLLSNSDNGLSLVQPVARAVLPGPHAAFRFPLLRDGLWHLLCDRLDLCL